jgi:ABC-2 type transport system ATP-binding protein
MTAALEIDQVSKWYGKVLALNSVSLELEEGIYGLVGANGAGKTTLLRMAAALVQPDEGEVRIQGVPTNESGARALVGYSPETDAFYEEMTGEEFLRTLARLHGYSGADSRARTSAVLDWVGMSAQAKKRVRRYSRGMRQRIKLAQSLLHDPALLILDEPFSGVDPVARAELVEFFMELGKSGRCLLFSSHELDEVERLTDRIMVLVKGRIAAIGSSTEVRARLDQQPNRFILEWFTGASQPTLGKLAGEWAEWQEVEGWDRLEPQEGKLGCTIRVTRQADFLRGIASQVDRHGWSLDRLENLDGTTRALVGKILGGTP